MALFSPSCQETSSYCFEGLLLLFFIVLAPKYMFCVGAKKHCPSWELNPGPSAYKVGALTTRLSGQLRIQCPHVLLVSDGPSPTRQVATPSDTQHAIFALFWEPQCCTCWQLLLPACNCIYDHNTVMKNALKRTWNVDHERLSSNYPTKSIVSLTNKSSSSNPLHANLV